VRPLVLQRLSMGARSQWGASFKGARPYGFVGYIESRPYPGARTRAQFDLRVYDVWVVHRDTMLGTWIIGGLPTLRLAREHLARAVDEAYPEGWDS
jgi:hypothetical protein